MKALKNIKSDAPAQRQPDAFIDELESCNAPSILGEKMHGPYHDCYGFHLTKSVSLIHRIGCHAHAVHLADLGDHKQLHGRDSRP